MSLERQRPGRLRAAQRRQLRRWVTHELPFAPQYRSLVDRGRDLRDIDDLADWPLTRLDEIDDPTALVLHPTEVDLLRHGEPGLRAQVLWARLTGRPDRADRGVIEPRYKPIQWVVADGVLLGFSAADLELLAELGRRLLALAGLHRNDTIVSILPVGPSLPWTQVSLGARRAGVGLFPLATAPTVDELLALAPSVLAGRAGDLLTTFDDLAAAGARWDALDTILVVGRPDAEIHDVLAQRSGATPVWAWAPSGVRALWAGCRAGGTSAGLHTWPDAGVTQVVPSNGDADHPGELVWTAVGWYGSIVVRLATGEHGELDDAPCPACGRTTPRVRPR